MTKQQRRMIEREFYGYKENQKKAAEYVASHAFDNFSVDYAATRVKSSPQNAPERRLVVEIGEAERAWKWCKVFENTLTKFRWEKKDELMRKKYIERKSPLNISYELHIDRATYFRWLEEIRLTAFQWATELKIL